LRRMVVSLTPYQTQELEAEQKQYRDATKKGSNAEKKKSKGK